MGLLADRCLAVEGLVALDEGLSIDSVLSGMAETCGQRKMHLALGKIFFERIRVYLEEIILKTLFQCHFNWLLHSGPASKCKVVKSTPLYFKTSLIKLPHH